LEHELKTLVLRAGEGYWAVHVRGDHEVSLRAVKRHLGRREAYLVSPEILEEMGLAPGTVCPFLPPIWDMPQLVSREVLSLEYVTTNNGTLNGFFRVDPRLLLRAPRIQAGDFEGRLSTEVALDEG
jgi:prolyl-tRNA editing enzyme YbaK/EbsC (Cys-tRNA(Pro) deacylase)